ncbi:MAG TPA: hypothetical protein VLU96_12110 [Gaiellaceae bacterium]|nr:hypothetical protein [Gaiellaceae bacterium]
MRSVLLLAYYFPPLGGGGVQRSLAFTRHLPEFGYRPVVITGPAAHAVDWGPVDATLTDGLPASLEVLRVAGPEPPRSGGWGGRAQRLLRRKDAFGSWWIEGAIEAARERAGGFDVVCASMSPFETAEAAARIARDAEKPWIADLRDPWALDDWRVFPTALHRRLELQTMRRVLSTASAVVMNTPEATEELLSNAPELRDKPVLTITNGFDARDFEAALPPRDPAVFRIVHAGHVHTSRDARSSRIARRVLGGAAPGLDTQTRSHLYLVDASQQLLERRPDLRGRLRIELVGPLSDADRLELPAFAVSHGYLSHRETIERLRTADLLFLPMHNLAVGLRARIVPGKAYEYLAAGAPILGAVPSGDARELLEAVGNADICAPDDAAAMSHAIEHRADDWIASTPPPPPDPVLVGRFERRRLTSDLARVLDLVLGGAAGADGVRAPETTEVAR